MGWRTKYSSDHLKETFRNVNRGDAISVGLRHQLETAGLVIGPYDLQIAAICLVSGLTLDTAEFSRVTGLIVEDWTFI